MLHDGDDGTEEFHNMSAPAMYVNQWRFRSVLFTMWYTIPIYFLIQAH